jgi:hypothetical protein
MIILVCPEPRAFQSQMIIDEQKMRKLCSGLAGKSGDKEFPVQLPTGLRVESRTFAFPTILFIRQTCDFQRINVRSKSKWSLAGKLLFAYFDR